LNDESGGKAGGSTTARQLIETWKAIFEKAFSPLAHDLARHVQTCGDLIVGQTLRREQDDLGPYHIAIR